MKKIREKHIYLVVAFVCMLVLIFTGIKVQAAVYNFEAVSVPLFDTAVGRYRLNYTGNTNFYDVWTTSGARQTELTYNDTGGTYQNSSTAVLSAQASGSTIARAYLVWQARGSSFEGANCRAATNPVIFCAANGTQQIIFPTYAISDARDLGQANRNYGHYYTMAADVTGIVRDAGFGSYSVANILRWEPSFTYPDYTGEYPGGDSVGAWQLVIIEENKDFSMRSVSLSIASEFHMGSDFTGQVTLGNGVKSKSAGIVNGQFLFSALRSQQGREMSEQIVTSGSSGWQSAYGAVTTQPGLYKNGVCFNSRDQGRGGICVDLSDVYGISNNATAASLYVRNEEWTTFNMLGMSMDIAYPDFVGTQTTTVNSSTSVTVTGNFTNTAATPNTGIYNGNLVLILDSALTAQSASAVVNGITIISPTSITGNQVIFSGDAVASMMNGSSISYSVDCYADNSGKTVFNNESGFQGFLRSDGVNTGYWIDNMWFASSSAVPKYSVQLEAGTGIESVRGGGDYTYGSIVDINAAVKPGYHWIGWNGSFNLALQENQFSMPNTNVVLQAYAEANSSTLKVNPNGGTWNGSTSIQTFTEDYNTTKDIPVPTRPGYRFVGWTKSEQFNGSITSVTEAATYTFGKTHGVTDTLTANWEINRSTLKVNPNGGTWDGSTDTQSFTQKYNTTKSIPVPTLEGYTFTRWEKSDPFNGSMTFLTEAATYTFGPINGVEDTLTAQWRINNYNVNLIAGTGIESVTGAGTYPYKSTVNISATLLPGYHWKNWTGTYNSEDIDYSFRVPAHDVTMTANGEANRYTIQFDGNGSTNGSMEPMTCTYDVSYPLTPNGFSKDGYQFLKWNTKPDGTGDSYEDGETVKNLTTTNNGTVILYAQWEANSYTLVFDANGGAGDIPSMQVSYDQSITLPNGAASYHKYTLDGVNVTQDVLSGAIVLDDNGVVVMMLDEETGVMMTPDGATVSEDGIVRNAETGETGTGNDLTPAQEELAEDIDEEPRPNKKAYESVFMGWSLEEEKDSFIPQWTIDAPVNVSAIVDMVGVTNSNGAIITLYAIWDDCPWIVAENLYYTLTQAQSGFITQDEILSHATASDREDGSPIEPGVHDNGTSFTIPDYLPTDFTQFQHEGAITENLTVVDSAGNTYWKQIWVYVVDTTAVPVGRDEYTRFIDEYFYNQPYDFGGLEDNSVWKTDPEYRSKLLTAFDNLKNDTPVMEFVYSPEDIDAMQQYVEEHGVGNSKEPDALENFYVQFCEPNRVR